jgi:hypothetical protein
MWHEAPYSRPPSNCKNSRYFIATPSYIISALAGYKTLQKIAQLRIKLEYEDKIRTEKWWWKIKFKFWMLLCKERLCKLLEHWQVSGYTVFTSEIYPAAHKNKKYMHSFYVVQFNIKLQWEKLARSDQKIIGVYCCLVPWISSNI